MKRYSLPLKKKVTRIGANNKEKINSDLEDSDTEIDFQDR